MDYDLTMLIESNFNPEKKKKPLDGDKLYLLKLNIAIRICEGLNELQKNKISLCDLKSDNILVKWNKES
jgi:serine/threonine protein kinase